MLEAYEHTGDDALLQKRILPTADAVIRFFDSYYKTNEQGQLVFHPSQALETWWDCTNAMPEIAGLHAVTGKLLALPERAATAAQRAYWKSFCRPVAAVADARYTRWQRRWRRPPSWVTSATPRTRNCTRYFLSGCARSKKRTVIWVCAPLKHRWTASTSAGAQDDIFMAYLGRADDARQGGRGSRQSP